MMVTGANDGIGFETARQLAELGERVFVHARTETKAVDAVDRLRKAGVEAKRLTPVFGDFTALAQVRTLAEQIRGLTTSLDVLVNNAGVFMNQLERTTEGFEMTVGVNHLAPFCLTHEVMGLLEAAGNGRVVNVSSVAHARGRVEMEDIPVPRRFEGYTAYASSKLMNVLLTHELHRRCLRRSRGVSIFALHPGVIATKLLHTGFGMGGASTRSGAQTSVFCATSPGLERSSGSYFSDAREVPCAPHANDPALEEALYERSCELTGCTPL